MSFDIPAQLPLSETTFFILFSLYPEQKHGYAILKEVEALSAGRIIFSTGTLYGALKRLLEQEWIERIEDPSQDEQGRPRKAYRLTEQGERLLLAEAERIRALGELVQQRMQGMLV